MRIGSLFSGVGGLDLAVEAVTGGTVVWHAETDPYAAHVLARRFPGVPNLGDVTTLVDAPPVDVLCGGFPCQDISQAGKGAGLHGARSGLWWEYHRIIREVEPSLVFVENVQALRSRGLADVLGSLAGLGFDAEWASVSAANVGASHRRRRLFILAYRDRDGRQGRGEEHDQYWRDACWNDPHGRDQGLVFPPPPDDGEGWARWIRAGGPAPGIRRGAYGPSDGVDARRRRGRLRCLGNGVVPRQAAAAFLSLIELAATDAGSSSSPRPWPQKWNHACAVP